MGHKMVDIGLNPVEGYSAKVTDSINYLSNLGTE
jgi:hypothetical protein